MLSTLDDSGRIFVESWTGRLGFGVDPSFYIYTFIERPGCNSSNYGPRPLHVLPRHMRWPVFRPPSFETLQKQQRFQISHLGPARAGDAKQSS